MAPWRELSLKHGLGSSAAWPLQDATGVFGAVALISNETDAFDTEEVALLDELASNLAYGINSLRLREAHARLDRRLQRSMSDTVQALATALEFRDPYTAGHQKHVAELAGGIARLMGVAENDIDGIVLAASLHDIGKLQIPAEILVKPGRLTPLEFALIRSHVQAGHDILKGIDFPWPVAEIVLQHHERLDGSGYPNGLNGDAIGLGAKIIAVADVFEAMTARRPYRHALGMDAAIAELLHGRGCLYHPPAVDACVALSRKPEIARLFADDADPSLIASIVERE